MFIPRAIIILTVLCAITIFAFHLFPLTGLSSEPVESGEQNPENNSIYYLLRKDIKSMNNTIRSLDRRISVLENKRRKEGDSEVHAANTSNEKSEHISLFKYAKLGKEESRNEQIRLDEQMMAEDIDPEWARNFESQIVDVLMSDKYKDTHLLQVSCRSTICKIEMAHKDEKERNRVEDALPFQLPDHDRTDIYHSQGEEGTLMSVLYVTR